MDRPLLSPDDVAFYEAEELARIGCLGEWPDVDCEEVHAFIRRALDAAGWSGGGVPDIRFNLPDDHYYAGVHHWSTDGEYLRLHPQRLSQWTILHEVAHWLRPHDRHGAQFRAVFIGLLRAALGDEAAGNLEAELKFAGLRIAREWLK